MQHLFKAIRNRAYPRTLDHLDQEELEAREDLRDPATPQIAFQFMGKKEIKENQVSLEAKDSLGAQAEKELPEFLGIKGKEDQRGSWVPQDFQVSKD